MENNQLFANFWPSFISLLYTHKLIMVPADFHDQCQAIGRMLENDSTGIISSLLKFSINSASSSTYTVECKNDNLKKLLNMWLSRINLSVPGVPTGLKELSKEYYKERWQGSSFCILNSTAWEELKIGQINLSVPEVLYYVNGSSVHVKRQNDKRYTLGSDEFYFDKEYESELDKSIVIQKPYNRWFDKYPTPYLIGNGVYKNYLVAEMISKKGEEVITKVIPYLFQIIKNTENLMATRALNYTDADLNTILKNFGEQVNSYENQDGKTPAVANQADTKYNHLIPDIKPIISEELFRQSYRAILSGLGFVDVIQGVSSTRKESVLNPKPFVSEVNAGVEDFKGMLLEIIYQIKEYNKKDHYKLFSDNQEIKIVSSPLQINVHDVLDAIRSAYDRGNISIRTYVESLGFDFDFEKEQRRKEAVSDDEIFYPHLTQNLEGIPDTNQVSKPQDENETKNKKSGTPESENFKNAIEDIEMAPYTEKNYPDYLDKYPEEARKVWIEAWNNVYDKTKKEEKAFPIAWNTMQKLLKKNNYIKKDGKWVNSNE